MMGGEGAGGSTPWKHKIEGPPPRCGLVLSGCPSLCPAVLYPADSSSRMQTRCPLLQEAPSSCLQSPLSLRLGCHWTKIPWAPSPPCAHPEQAVTGSHVFELLGCATSVPCAPDKANAIAQCTANLAPGSLGPAPHQGDSSPVAKRPSSPLVLCLLLFVLPPALSVHRPVSPASGTQSPAWKVTRLPDGPGVRRSTRWWGERLLYQTY